MIPIASVVIPCFNRSLTLREAVESVLAQTVDNLECLIVDDGSDDGSLQLAKQLAVEDRRVKVFTHPNHANLGVSVSRNIGLENASGRFIGFLDSDDAWLPQKLEKQISFLENNTDVGMVFSDTFICTDPDPRRPMITQDLSRDEFRKGMSSLFSGSQKKALELLLFDPSQFRFIPSPTPLVRRELFCDGLRFVGPPRLSLQYEDLLMWKCIATRTPIAALDEPLAIYRVHPSSFTGKFHRTKGLLAHLRGLAEVDQLWAATLPADFEDRRLLFKVKEQLDDQFLRAVTIVPIGHLPAVCFTCTVRGIAFPLLGRLFVRLRSAISHYLSRLRARWPETVSRRGG